jgi:hypothetical protein
LSVFIVRGNQPDIDWISGRLISLLGLDVLTNPGALNDIVMLATHAELQQLELRQVPHEGRPAKIEHYPLISTLQRSDDQEGDFDRFLSMLREAKSNAAQVRESRS